MEMDYLLLLVSVVMAFTIHWVSKTAHNDARVPEEKRGILSRLLFLWINPLLVRVPNSTLSINDAPLLNSYMNPVVTRKRMQHSWSLRGKMRALT